MSDSIPDPSTVGSAHDLARFIEEVRGSLVVGLRPGGSFRSKDGIELNGYTDDYLEAIVGYIDDRYGSRAPIQASWQTFADVLLTALAYE